MRSTTSSSDLRTIVKDNFKKYWTIPALGLVWFFLWGLIPALLSDYTADALRDLARNENFGYLTGILILAVPAGMSVFSYLQNPSSANYMHSLPVSRKKLFAAGVLSGVLMMAGPILANGILMSLIAGNLAFVTWMIITFISCFAIFAVTVFAAMISGNVLMHLFNTAFFNGFVTIAILAFYTMLDALLYGYTPSEGWMTCLIRSNALTGLIGEIDILMCVIYLAVAALALLTAWACYRRRPIERTGESLVFSWTRGALFLYCIFFGSILTGLVFSQFMNDGNVSFDLTMIIGMVLGGALTFVVGSLMIDRSGKIFTRRNLLPAGLALVLALGLVAGMGNDITGYSSRVPAAEDIKAVYLDAEDATVFHPHSADGGSYSLNWDAKYYETEGIPVVSSGERGLMGMSSAESVNAVRDLQQALLDQDRTDGNEIGTVRIIYDLKSGKRIQREYEIIDKEYMGDECTIDDLQSGIADAAEAYYNAAEYKEKYSPANLKPEVFGQGTAQYYPDYFSNEMGDISYAVPRKDMESLQNALAEDFRAGTFDDYQDCTSGIVLTLAGSSWEDLTFPVPDSGAAMKTWEKKHAELLEKQ